MTPLQTRLAQADKPSRELLVECYAAVFGAPSLEWRTEDDRARRFIAMLDAEAWTSAVEMLVPPDLFWSISNAVNWAKVEDVNGNIWSGDATHPALALAIACLKARGL